MLPYTIHYLNTTGKPASFCFSSTIDRIHYEPVHYIFFCKCFKYNRWRLSSVVFLAIYVGSVFLPKTVSIVIYILLLYVFTQTKFVIIISICSSFLKLSKTPAFFIESLCKYSHQFNYQGFLSWRLTISSTAVEGRGPSSFLSTTIIRLLICRHLYDRSCKT